MKEKSESISSTINCQYCGVSVSEPKLTKHTHTKCPQSPLNPNNHQCEYCNLMVKSTDVNDHFRKCNSHPLNQPCACEYCRRRLKMYEYDSHIYQTCDKSPLVKKTPCPYCGRLIKERLYDAHIQERCAERKYFCKCEFCSETMRWELYDKHVTDNCQTAKRKVECQYCGRLVQAHKYENHLNENCTGGRYLTSSLKSHHPNPVKHTTEYVRFVPGGLPDSGKRHR